MKILITGSSGMLGRALCRELSDKYEVVGLDVVREQRTENREQRFVECDITDREKAIAEITSIRPDIVIHTAAYTDVDGCEQNSEQAQRVNAQGTQTIALACQSCGAFLGYISTDFVFDGKKKSAYLEEDSPNPINVYGKSKLDGEKYIQSIFKKYIIIRSSWLFAKGGENFVDAILEKTKTEKEIKVVNDQFGSPTYAQDLAGAIGKLIGLTKSISGMFHITNSGSCSWYEFALAIKENVNLDTNIVPISSEQYPSRVRRPKMSVLNNQRYEQLRGEKLRPWQEALRAYLDEVEGERKEIKR